MTKQMKRAYKLYTQYKTHTFEYKQIAAELGLSATELNAKIHPIHMERKFRKGSARFSTRLIKSFAQDDYILVVTKPKSVRRRETVK